MADTGIQINGLTCVFPAKILVVIEQNVTFPAKMGFNFGGRSYSRTMVYLFHE